MKPKRPNQAESPVEPQTDEFWDLRLYVTGRSPKSRMVLSKLEATCERYLVGRYRITVIDLLSHPHRAKADQILATPTVVRALPMPMRTLIGNLSDTENVLSGLDMLSAG